MALQLHKYYLILIMAQLTTFYPIEQHPTCATCPFFQDFNGRDRGLCEVFDRVLKKHNLRTSDCDCSIESLLKQPRTCMIQVELISSEVEDDGSGHAVPVNSRTIEVMVAQPLKALIEMAIALRKDLKGYKIAQYWIPDGGYEI
ncbi:MAG: hypothetical protein HC820_08285 [Hydrococcus sp. RM1_1_31]|nr:hypothetical protein [Hydrococcus sp. RM1_1_31]